VIADFKAKQQQGGVQNLLQNGPTSDANAKPIGTADINNDQVGNLKTLKTAPALSPEASASNARLAAASAKTSDHSLLKRDVTDALKTGGAQAQAEVRDLTQQMDQLQPGTGTKLAQEVGLEIQVPSGATTLSAGTDNSVAQSPAHPGFPPRKPNPPTFWDYIAGNESSGQPNNGYGTVNGNPEVAGDFALGRYQIRTAALKDTDYLDKQGHWTGKDGIKSHSDFLKNPSIQTKAINEYRVKIDEQLTTNGSMKHLGKKIDGIKSEIKITHPGLVAASHRQGAQKVRDYLNHLKSHDWKSDASTFGKNRKAYLRVETRLREYQNRPSP